MIVTWDAEMASSFLILPWEALQNQQSPDSFLWYYCQKDATDAKHEVFLPFNPLGAQIL